jgi:hypothetical protein
VEARKKGKDDEIFINEKNCKNEEMLSATVGIQKSLNENWASSNVNKKGI